MTVWTGPVAAGRSTLVHLVEFTAWAIVGT